MHVYLPQVESSLMDFDLQTKNFTTIEKKKIFSILVKIELTFAKKPIIRCLETFSKDNIKHYFIKINIIKSCCSIKNINEV